eukprot:XP_020393707.1 uncharacterized protein LOC109939795 [Zea mays]
MAEDLASFSMQDLSNLEQQIEFSLYKVHLSKRWLAQRPHGLASAPRWPGGLAPVPLLVRVLAAAHPAAPRSHACAPAASPLRPYASVPQWPPRLRPSLPGGGSPLWPRAPCPGSLAPRWPRALRAGAPSAAPACGPTPPRPAPSRPGDHARVPGGSCPSAASCAPGACSAFPRMMSDNKRRGGKRAQQEQAAPQEEAPR